VDCLARLRYGPHDKHFAGKRSVRSRLPWPGYGWVTGNYPSVCVLGGGTECTPAVGHALALVAGQERDLPLLMFSIGPVLLFHIYLIILPLVFHIYYKILA
jgi:hypothetical protein